MNRLLIALFVVVLIGAGVAFLPLRVVLDWIGVEQAGLTAVSASGTVWSGRLSGAALHGVDLGKVDAHLQPMALGAGAIRIDAVAEGGAVSGRAAFVRRGGSAGIEDVAAVAPLSLFRTALPLSGALSLEAVNVHFRDGRCVLAEGRVSTDALQRNAGLFGASGPVLTGVARCEGAAVVFPMQGRGPLGGVSLEVSVDPDGRYRTSVRIEPADESVSAAVRLAGFAPSGSGYERSEEGRWRR